jgi:predicted PurR-regulated permease PerM
MARDPQAASNLDVSMAVVGSGALLVCTVIVLGSFLPALLWAAILAVAFWPVYRRIVLYRPGIYWSRLWAPLISTFAIGLAIATPVALGALEIGHESRAVMRWLMAGQHDGFPLPAGVAHLPLIGGAAASWWQDNLASPNSATELVHRVGPGQLAGWTRSIGIEILHRALLFIVALATLFMLFRDGEKLSLRLAGFCRRTFGKRSDHVLRQIVIAIHGTVDGLVLVGIAEGAVLGVAYWLADVPHPLAFAVATSILAIIPFGAPLAFCVAALFLLAAGKATAAVILVLFGFLVLFLSDHIVRPILIGGATRIPFLLVLLGIIGGLAALGLVGIFVGPALMAVLVTLWNDFTGPDAPAAASD